MRKIICMLKPFEMQQRFFVYEDGNKIATEVSNIDHLTDVLFALAEEYDVKDVNLVGAKSYSTGIKKRIESNELMKYAKNELKIELI